MCKIDILAKIENVDEIFSLPQTLLSVLQEVESEDWSAKTIADIISKDPGITTRVLQMANSSYYRRGGEISTVNRAVVVLGASMVKCLALSVAIFNPSMIEKSSSGTDLPSLFVHYLSTAIMAKDLADAIDYPKQEEAFTAGLLHDIGNLFLFRVAPDEYGEILKNHESGPNLVNAERDAFNTDHAEVGYLISRKWRLPSELQNAIGNHHRVASNDNPGECDKLDLIVAIANLLNRQTLIHTEGTVEQVLSQINILSEALGIDQDVIDRITDHNLQETFKAAEILGIEVGDPIALLQKANKQIVRSYVTIETLFRERQELSRQVIEEEHKIGAMKSKNIAVATLSHYINNAATIISGKIQLIDMLLKNKQISDKDGKLEDALGMIDTSLTKILAVLAELKSLTSLEDANFYKDSSAINIDEKISQRLASMKKVLA